MHAISRCGEGKEIYVLQETCTMKYTLHAQGDMHAKGDMLIVEDMHAHSHSHTYTHISMTKFHSEDSG